MTGLTNEEKKFVARQNLLTKQQRAWNLRKQVDGKGAEKSTFFVDHEINVPTMVQRGKLSPYIPYQEKGGILKKPCKDSTNSLNPHSQANQSQQRGSECYGRADMPTHSERTQWIGKRRYFIVDTGASYHIIHESNLTRGERRSIQDGPETFITTANGRITVNKCANVYVDELQSQLIAYVVNKSRPWCPPLLSLGMLCISGKYKYLIITEHLPEGQTFIPNIDIATGPYIRIIKNNYAYFIY